MWRSIIIFSIILSACEPVQQYKSPREDSAVISQYMLSHLPEPSAYQPLDYYFVAGLNIDCDHIIEHHYRGTNDLLIPPTEKILFRMDENGSIIGVLNENDIAGQIYLLMESMPK